MSPFIISMRTAAVSGVITFFLGIVAAKLVISMKNDYWKMTIDGILTLPMVLPPTVAGFFLLYIFGVQGPVGSFFLEYFSWKIAFSWSATVLAAIVISFPLMYRSARGALEQVDKNYRYAAQTLGLSESYIFFKIQLPLATPGILSGGILSFARGLGEFGATAMIASNIAGKTRTLPLSIYSAVAAGRMEDAYQEVAIIVLFSFVVVVAMNLITIKSNKKGMKRKKS
ncbi:molybdate ABC transporter permease subunit [Tetragenococcus halophilus]|uniref:molybdate ABC transporter permease subunit n=1 Tax=Tetragenococcus halophilus TaxID=51669 RepID=UPI001927CB76|nr:molybdate ABC transporter permease subunit [Tetragenococcus halophilus]MCF1601652.1 molybdate ABC transporter permease subunit [Tetragenococcus halophilus]MCF1676497.1 molybdate ABC transporter permease subunit [Tetragenococcus halophilus]GEQ37017.1 putative molybdate ABC transporter permease protein [Tetragenococcus halophilus]GEQ39376.1 putative molybdate ABC transporter permease protein [Tetragenococcus halophilus]GEQ41517.1 putative molybdate ABC transporter permease protein [Tetragenoc